jgi:uncharacterized SAM-binding protein YcdF (DUF218 family)
VLRAASTRGATEDSVPIRTIIITIAIAALLILPVGAVAQIVLTSQFDDRTQTQAIVVLDAGRYWGDPREVRHARWEHAADLYREGVAPVIVLTGRQRAADSARNFLAQRGVPEQDVVIFPSTVDTVGSLRVLASVMSDLGWQSATLVTDRPHAARAGAIATQFGIDAHLSPTERGPATSLSSEVVGTETAALLRYYLLQRWGTSTG